MKPSLVAAIVLLASLLAMPAIVAGEAPVAEEQVHTVVAAGDIANCTDQQERRRARATAAKVRQILAREPAAVVATLGDHVYRAVSADDYRRCFARTWGSFRSRIHPAPGNHDYSSRNAPGYFRFFGAAAGPRDAGYYAYSLGDWRVIVLNTNDGGCQFVRCDEGSPQLAWLRDELARNAGTSCTLAYWHHPRFSSGDHGDARYVDAIWRTLASGGVDLALNAHDHHYERFAPMDADGKAAADGMRAFIVGTGGGEFYQIKRVSPNSEVRRARVSGVLELTLRPGGYDWAFDALASSPGAPFSDRGSGSCH